MANLVTNQFAILSALAALLLCLLVASWRRRAQIQETPIAVPQTRVVAEKSERVQAKPVQSAATPKPAETEPQPSRPKAPFNNGVNNEMKVSAPPAAPAAPKPPVLVLAPESPENRRQRMLDDISANIRKSLIKPVPTYSPVQYPETPKESEYVRVKKQIITPHGQIRFSILRDSLSLNMLAVFRRASMDWEKPEDLIGFIPPYLEAEAEIVNDQVLLVGTPGHPEKLAIPIRSVDADFSFRDCFDFISDVRTATNTPAVLLPSDNEFELVSRGVITQPMFTSSVDWVHAEVRRLERNHDMKFLVERSAENQARTEAPGSVLTMQ